MAKFRMVRTDFWKNPMVSEEMTLEEKYFFLYLLTNPHTTQIGIYKITKKTMAFDTGFSIDCIDSLMDKMINHYQMIRYNSQTREIALKNWGKYNLYKGGKPVMDCIISELKEVEDTTLITYVANNINKDEIIAIFMSYCEKEKPYDEEIMEVDEEEMDSSQLNDPSAEVSETEEYIEDTLSKQKKDTKQPQPSSTIENSIEADISIHSEQKRDAVKAIVTFWDQNGFGLSNVNAKEQLLCWLDDSRFMNPKEIILKAMQIACSNNKRSLNYVVGILKNWQNQALLTADEIDLYTSNKRYVLKEEKSSETRTKESETLTEFKLDLTAGENW